jgi:hypothetical protein
MEYNSGTDPTQIPALSIGGVYYFHYVQMAARLFWLMSIVACAMIWYCQQGPSLPQTGSYVHYQGGPLSTGPISWTLGQRYYSDNTSSITNVSGVLTTTYVAYLKFEVDVLYGVLDAILIVLFILFLFLLPDQTSKVRRFGKQKRITASAFTIEFRRLPPRILAQELIHHMTSKFGPVVSVVCACQDESIIEITNETAAPELSRSAKSALTNNTSMGTLKEKLFFQVPTVVTIHYMTWSIVMLTYHLCQ